MKRSAPLKRTPMKRRRRRARPGKDDAAYLDWIRRQPCCANGCILPPPSDPHHRPGAGMGLRSDDHEAIPLCRAHHDDVDAFRGPFKNWTRERRQTWHACQVAIHRARYWRETSPTSLAF